LALGVFCYRLGKQGEVIMPLPLSIASEAKARRFGFTIVELLVVIAIIGVLVSILLPAVNAVRDSASRTQNLNNLKQIGTAIASYEASKKTYPPLVKYPPGPRNADRLKRATSWAFEILPHLEQQNIYDRFDPTQDCSDRANTVAMATPIEIYANPRRRDARAISPFVSGKQGLGTLLDYSANGGVVVDSNDQPIQLPNDPSGANLQTPYQNKFHARYSGPFHHDLAVPAAAIKDGLGSTLCVGDRWIGPANPSGPIWNDLAGLAGESLPTIVRYGNADTASAQGLPFPTGNTDTSIYKFGSVKGSEACFVFLDGHAIWLPYDTDPDIFRRLCAINDGLPTPPLQ
jgi:prepilin-type N-terminal cleavage/methylation domain-containing protein